MVKALILVSYTLGLIACPSDLVATGTSIKVLDLIDEGGKTYAGVVVKGSTTILVTLPNDYTLPAQSTLKGDYETEAAFEDACYKTNGDNSKTLIKFKMTPKLTMSKGATLGADSELKDDGKPQVFAANKYLKLSILNGSKKTTYKVFVGTQAQLEAAEATEQAGGTTHIASFDLYTNNGPLSLSTVITHANDENEDKNLITIVLPYGTPRVTAGFSQIRLESPNNALITPVSGTLPANFEPTEPIAGTDSVAGVTYTVYPKGQTKDSLFARTYTVVLKRAAAAQETPSAPQTPLDPSSTHIASFDLYTNNGPLSVSTLITHANDENTDKNLISIVLPYGTPRITAGFSQIRLESPNNALITPVSGTLPANFEPTEPIAGTDSVAGVTYTVYPKGQTPTSSSARTYTVVLKRAAAAQETPPAPSAPSTPPAPGANLDKLTLSYGKLKGTVPAGTKIGVFTVSGSGASLGTPVYTLEAGAFGTTNGIQNNRDNGKFHIAGADLFVGAAALPSGLYYIVAKVTMVDANGAPLPAITPITQAFKIGVSETPPPSSGWGD